MSRHDVGDRRMRQPGTRQHDAAECKASPCGPTCLARLKLS